MSQTFATKYLGTTVTNKSLKTKKHINSANASDYSLSKLTSSSMLLRTLKINICICIYTHIFWTVGL
jgi:hypothetical protein